jgi:hypothetical protein
MLRDRLGLTRFALRFGNLKYPLAVFFIVLTIRMVPEILMGAYPLGFDTVAYYIPITTQWLSGGVDFYQAMATAPLFYMFLSGVTVLGVPFVLSLKVLPSLMHALLALTIYYYANKALNWSSKKSLLTGLLATLYFVALRVSWDMLRNQLGLIFLFLTLMLSALVLKGGPAKWKRYILLSLSAVLTVLSHQLTAVLLIIAFAALIVHFMLKGERVKAKGLILALAPATILFLTFNIFALTAAAGAIVSNTAILPFQGSLSNLGFFFYCYLPLLALSIIGIRYFRDIRLNSWTLWISFILFIPLLFPSTLGLGGHRWTFLLVYPLAFLVMEALDRLKPRTSSIGKYLAFGGILLLFITQITSLSVGFMVKSPDGPLSYFDPQQYNQYPYYIQSSMLQNTMPIEHISDFTKAIAWLDANYHNSTFVLPNQLYGLALIMVKNPVKIVNMGELTPFNPSGKQGLSSKCLEALQSGSSHVYTVWWAPNFSWYGISFPLKGFVEEQRFGTFSVYAFSDV